MGQVLFVWDEVDSWNCAYRERDLASIAVWLTE